MKYHVAAQTTLQQVRPNHSWSISGPTACPLEEGVKISLLHMHRRKNTLAMPEAYAFMWSGDPMICPSTPPPPKCPHSSSRYPAFLLQTSGEGEKRGEGTGSKEDERLHTRIDSGGVAEPLNTLKPEETKKESMLAEMGGRATMELESLLALPGQGGQVVDIPQAILG